MKRDLWHAHERYVPVTTPRRNRRELLERAIFPIALLAIPFVLAILPRQAS